ncbi:MAG: PAS domain S-box protein [Verrucomicrobia bacterium]|nr:PAS domain S-box protein [Prolixibacteraceae bacterium]
MGVLSLHSKDVGFFTSEEKQLLEKIGGDISFALDAMATENENRLAQEALINSEIHYRSLFESSKDGILIIDGESNRVTDVNPCLTHMSGYSKEYFLQNTLNENRFFKGISDIDYYLSEVKEKQYIHYEDVLLKSSDGRKLYVEFVSHTYLVENKKVIKCSLRDITERKLAEIKLKEALTEAQRFRQTLDYLSNHIYIKDLQSRYVYANKHTLKFFGSKEEELLGYDDSSIFSNKALQKIKDIDRRVFNGEETNEEVDMFDMYGVRHVFWETKVPIYTNSENPSICGLLGISTNITERKLMEEKLGESEERFRELYDNAKIGMYRTTPEGSIVMANKAMVKMLGYSSFEELTRINLEDQHIEVFLKRNEFLEKFTQADELIDWEALWIHVDGSDIYIRESARAIRDEKGKILYFDGVVENITDRKRAMKALCESEAYLQTLVQTIPDLIWLKDVNGVFLKCNPSFANYMGARESELIGKTDYDFVEFERAEKFRQTDLKALAEGKPTTFEEWYTFNDQNEPIFMETTKTPMFDSNGAVIGILGIGHNITHRKLAEKELIKAKEKAEESDRLKSSFLANMSHEVRTPLNSILGFSSLLADADFNKVQRDEFIHHIIKNGHNLLNIINDIMDISKIESGEIKIFKSPVKAQEFISGIKDQFSYDSVGNDVELKLCLPCEDEETIVIADKDRLYQVFCNLVSNAMKFTPSGHIEMGYQPKGDQVEFYVKDTGIGIPAEYHAKIFERFRQVETEKTRKYGGNGLGLAITKNLIELMDGRIWLNSEPGKGSAFHFTLPVHTEGQKD